MTSVTKKHRKESFESLMRRFKKSYEKNDIANLVKSREYYLKPSLKRHRAKDVAVKIEQKRQDEQKLKKFGSR
jgi:ribosomal protein S21|tara:strand:- start:1776 stop:1994 length:219 start_codon:yes stop_codon:yes gene_type:complete